MKKVYASFEEWLQEKEQVKKKNRRKKLPWRKILKAKGYKKIKKNIWFNQETGAEVDKYMLYTLREVLGRDYTMIDNIKGAESKSILEFKLELETLEMEE